MGKQGWAMRVRLTRDVRSRVVEEREARVGTANIFDEAVDPELGLQFSERRNRPCRAV